MQTARPRQQARSRRTRAHIAQAALTVFALKGYAAASMDDICLAAACSKGGLYHHYPTKSAVLAGVVQRLGESGALGPPSATAAQSGIAPEALGRVLIEIWAEAARNPAIRERVLADYAQPRDAAPAGQAAELVSLLRVGTLIQSLTQGAGGDVDAAARRLGIERAA